MPGSPGSGRLADSEFRIGSVRDDTDRLPDQKGAADVLELSDVCLLYTSDAADE